MSLRIRLFAAVFLLALLARLIRYQSVSPICLTSVSSDIEMSRIAQSIALRGQFADPYPTPTGFTAHHAPVYPFLISFFYLWPPHARALGRIGLNVFFSSLACAGVFLTGLALRFPPAASFVSASICAVLPARFLTEVCNDQEACLTAFLTVAAIGFTAIWIRGSWRKLLLLGLMWGAVLLSAPALATVYLAVLVVAFANRRDFFAAFGMLIATCAVLAPWTIRNHNRLGSWLFVRDSLGLELRVSNADNALADANENSEYGAMQTYHPFFNNAVSEQVRRVGEPRVYSRYARETFEWMRSHPGDIARLTFQHFSNFWLPLGSTGRQALWRAASWLFAAAGLVFFWNRNTLAAIWLLALLTLYPLPYYFVQSFPRYAYPLEWALTLLAVYGAYELVRELVATRRIVAPVPSSFRVSEV